MEKKKLERISQLSQKERSVGLSEEEKREQAVLRQEYLDAIRKSLTDTLEHTYVVDEQGHSHPVRRRSPDGR